MQDAAEAALVASDEWDTDYDGPVSLFILLYFPPIRSGRLWKTSPPDIDKCVRGVADALTKARVYRDDARVVHLEAQKMHGVVTGATIRVRTVENHPNERAQAA